MQKFSFLVSAILIISILISCDSGSGVGNDSVIPDPDPGIENQFNLVNALPGLSFEKPLDIQNAGDNSNRLFIVEQRGKIQVINNAGSTNQLDVQLNGVPSSDTFLDIQDRIDFDNNESGLLGLAFHPNYETNGRFYVNYTAENPFRSVISEFEVSQLNPNQADPSSEIVLLEIDQPTALHNGGQLVFGPDDGYLYISMGDGGPPFGRDGTSQDLTNLLGKIIRIDVDNPEGLLNYGIPSDNPLANNNSGFREEIYTIGLRNPWRLAFDQGNGTLWTGDVGEVSREEINQIKIGENYGWPISEGGLCFNPPSGCDFNGITLPKLQYNRSQGAAVIGGIFYYGTEHPDLFERYIYADFVSGRVWSFKFNLFNGAVTDNKQLLQFAPFSIVGFGLDEAQEPYIASFDGNIYKLERIETME